MKKTFFMAFWAKSCSKFCQFWPKYHILKFLESLDLGRYHKSAEYFFQRSAQIPRIRTVKILRFRYMLKKKSCNLQIRSQNVTNFLQKLMVEMTPKFFWEFFRTMLMIWKEFGRFWWKKKFFYGLLRKKLLKILSIFAKIPYFWNFLSC